MTVPGKNAPGLKGFPTPDEIPEEVGYLVFYFPNNNDWVGVLLGAVMELTYEWNWYEWGVLTPAEAAEAFKTIVNDAPYNLLEQQTPTPYWDDTGDVDDQDLPENQIWYGHWDGLTFVEDIAIWGIAGFLAYSGNIGAAVQFITIAPKFTLAWKKDGLGGAIRVFIDGVDNGLFDTAGDPDEVLEVDFVGDPDLETHTILQILESVPTP
jgi:hypothetical protein